MSRRQAPRYITNENVIGSFVHCGLCLDEWKADTPGAVGTSPRQYAQLEIGFTDRGVQVWCKRHEVNVMHIDFEGAKHPANTSAARLGVSHD